MENLGTYTDKAVELFLSYAPRMVLADPRVFKDPAPMVAVKELADSSVNLVVRPWCSFKDYWSVYFDMTERAKQLLEENSITIPFPQRDVHLYNTAA